MTACRFCHAPALCLGNDGAVCEEHFALTNGTATHPVQHFGRVRGLVTLRAYEVYRELHGAQVALVTGECRSGFGAGELFAYLYARSFPREQWRARFDEALRGTERNRQLFR